jgi:hypothetical protein
MIKQFTSKELEQMFYVVRPDSKGRMRKMRLRKERIKKRGRIKHPCDNVKEGITDKPPGSSRVADLATFYHRQLDFSSAFNIPGIDY